MRTLFLFCILCFASQSIRAQNYILPAAFPFKTLEVQGNIHLELIVSDKAQMEFVGDTVPEQLDIRWSDGILSLKVSTELKKTTAIKVKLYLESLSALEITRGAVVQSADILPASILTLKTDTGGKAEFTIEADSVSARLNQGSDIILSGTTRSQSIHANTVGNYLAYELEAKKTWVKAGTGAQVKVNTSDYLKATSTSGAFVGYRGKPDHTAFKNNTGGKITQEIQ